MKNLFIIASLFISTAACGAGYGDKKDANIGDIPAGKYVLEPYHGHLTFSYMHSGWSKPSVKFDTFDLTLDLDQENQKNSSVSMVIDATSINSGSKIFNQHLAGGYFNTEEHPEIVVTGKGYNQTSPSTGTISAEMTIAGITQPVELDVTINGAGAHPHPMAKEAPGLGVSVSAVVDGRPFFPKARFPAPKQVYINLEAELISEKGGKELAAAFAKVFGTAQ